MSFNLEALSSIFDDDASQDALWNAGVSDEFVRLSKSRDAKILKARTAVQTPRLKPDVRNLALECIRRCCMGFRLPRNVCCDALAMFDNFARVSSEDISVESLPPTLASLMCIVSRRDGISLPGGEVALAMRKMLPSKFAQSEVSHDNAESEASMLVALDWRVNGPSSVFFWVETFCKRVQFVMRGDSSPVIANMIQRSVQGAEKMMTRLPSFDHPAWHVAVGLIATSMVYCDMLSREVMDRELDVGLIGEKDIACLGFLAGACCCSMHDAQNSCRILKAAF
jgi:hypothetical protein